MDRKSILAIEKIISCINELKIITKGKNFNYLDDRFEMPIVCGLVNDIDMSINKINSKIKNKYNNINWNVITSRVDIDGLKLGKIWELATGVLENELYDKLNIILENELPVYYEEFCDRKHREAVKKSMKEREKLENDERLLHIKY